MRRAEFEVFPIVFTSHSLRRLRLLSFAIITVLLPTHFADAQEGTPAATSNQPSAAAPKGVVWILLDACRSDHLSCYGYSRKTSPNIDALAKRGTLFERNYSQAPNTLLSVPTYMTGRFEPVSYEDPRLQNNPYVRAAPDDEILAPTLFSSNGFQTAMFSASPWYTEHANLSKSFDSFEWLAHGPNTPEGTFESRNPDLFRWLDEHTQDPFFLYVHSLDTHEPRFPNNTSDTWLDPDFPVVRDQELRRWSGGPYSAEDQEHIGNLYDGGVKYADDTVGEVIGKLDSLGVLDTTLIIISSDHGEILAQDGKTLGHPGTESYDDLLRTPLVLAGPGIPSALRVQAKSQNADILPTLVELFALNSNAHFDGKSLLPGLARPDSPDTRAYAYARTQASLTVSVPNRVLIYDDFKFDLQPFDDEPTWTVKNRTRGPIEIWTMPDTITTRRAANPSADRIDAAKQIARDRFVPLWQEKEKLAKLPSEIFFIDHGKGIVADALSAEDSSTDNKWEYRRRELLANSIHEDDYLISYTWREKSPELIFGAFVPNGTYRVSVFCRTLDSGNVNRGSSFRFLVTPEKSWRLFEIEPGTPSAPNRQWVDVGTYTVTDGNFAYWLGDGNQDDYSVIGSLRFIRDDVVGSVLPTAEELEEERERLKSLGYLE